MIDKFNQKYRISSARALWHDYNGGAYFITVCTTGMKHYFGEIVNGEMQYSTLGKFVEENILNLTIHYPYAEIQLHQVMPNHLHLIALVNGDRGQEMDGLNSLNGLQDLQITQVSQNTQNTQNTQVSQVETGRAPSLQENPEYLENPDCQENTKNEQQPNQDNKQLNEKMQLISHKKGLLSTAMGGLKSATTRFANDNNITFGWQTRFHDHIIRNRDELNRIALYIMNNPATWENDKFYSP
jgi:REP element-mobilizing transposase RayT